MQRLKLASELTKSGQIYIFDEPTTGLHRRDVQVLLTLLRRLVSRGNTVIVVGASTGCRGAGGLGPGYGPRCPAIQGRLPLFAGTPQELLKCSTSETARFLAEAAGVSDKQS